MAGEQRISVTQELLRSANRKERITINEKFRSVIECVCVFYPAPS